MACMSFKKPFTCTDVKANPQTMKGLADDGYLRIVGNLHRRAPYLYVVPEQVLHYYGQQVGQNNR